MTTKTPGSYADPNYTVRREHCPGEVGAAASTDYGKFAMFQALKLVAVHLALTVAGTNTAAGVDIYVGTDSVGAITFGTAAAGGTYTTTIATASRDVTSLKVVKLTTKADSGTAKFVPTYEFEVAPGTEVTA